MAVLKRYPILSRFFIWVVMPLLILVVAFGIYFSNSLPKANEVVSVSGIDSQVTVTFDEYSVPRITAQTDNDAFFTLGYLHAQNRLWQMELQRRLGQGRLSEVFGETQLSTDKYMRTLGLHRVAEQNWRHLPHAQKTVLEAYSAGINAWLASDTVLPIEFKLLDIKPEPWQPKDSLLQIKLMALNLDGNFRKDLEYSLMVNLIGKDKAAELKVAYPANSDTVTQTSVDSNKASRELLALTDQINDQFRLGGLGVGSNGWVVAGEHTTSGKPILANDPHLKTQIPSAWYLAELKGRDLNVVGATFPGLPYVLIGHNYQISWGTTALHADVQDIYWERTHPENENLYEADGAWLPIASHEESIEVRSAFPGFLNKPFLPVKWLVRSTRNGPLISDPLGKVTTPMALKWTALEADDSSLTSFHDINYASDWQDFTKALEDYKAPALNFLYADTKGNIGYTPGGAIPLRAQGDGSLPHPGWDSASDWTGFIPFEELPKAFNPESGMIISANNKVHGDHYPYQMSWHWAPGYRADRIKQLLDEGLQKNNKLDLDYMSFVQGDVKNIQAAQVIELLRNVEAKTDRQKQAINYLLNWDLYSDKDSVAAAIYHMWLSKFSRSILSGRLQQLPLHNYRRGDHQRILRNINPLFLQQLVNGQLSDWCDLPGTTSKQETCQQRGLDSLDQALDDLELFAGKDMSDWLWGDVHQTYYPHSGFSNVNPLSAIFNRGIASGGDNYTVNVAFTVFFKDKGFQQLTSANYRQIIDLSDWENSGFVIDTGQSGNVFSQHYDDQIVPHNEVQLLPMHPKSAQLADNSLRLQPAG